jgi:hypothetical protein
MLSSPWPLPSRLPLSPSAAHDGYSVVPASQFVVTRTAFKNDTSSYYVNDKKATMVEVRDRGRRVTTGSRTGGGTSAQLSHILPHPPPIAAPLPRPRR